MWLGLGSLAQAAAWGYKPGDRLERARRVSFTMRCSGSASVVNMCLCPWSMVLSAMLPHQQTSLLEAFASSLRLPGLSLAGLATLRTALQGHAKESQVRLSRC